MKEKRNEKVSKIYPALKPVRKGRAFKKLETPEYQELIQRVYDYVKDGLRSNEIFAILTIEDAAMTHKKFTELLTFAYAYAENTLHKDREYVFQLHMDRYEKIFMESMIMVDSWNRPLDPRKDWKIMTAKYMNALQALESKERLIGLHDKSVVLELNEQKISITEKEELRGSHTVPGYDLDLLTMEEKKELLALIKEARTVPIEGIQRVVIKKTVIEINQTTGDREVKQEVETHDIEFEEMPDPVVDKFKQLKSAEEEPEVEMGAIVIDNVPKVAPKVADDIKENLNTSLLESFKKKMDEKRLRGK